MQGAGEEDGGQGDLGEERVGARRDETDDDRGGGALDQVFAKLVPGSRRSAVRVTIH